MFQNKTTYWNNNFFWIPDFQALCTHPPRFSFPKPSPPRLKTVTDAFWEAGRSTRFSVRSIRNSSTESPTRSFDRASHWITNWRSAILCDWCWRWVDKNGEREIRGVQPEEVHRNEEQANCMNFQQLVTDQVIIMSKLAKIIGKSGFKYF